MITVRRILLAVDASPASLEATRTAIDLAVRTAAELVAIFVDEEQPANLPGMPGGAPASATRRLRADRAVKRRVESLAGRHRNRVSFRSIRGRPRAEILRATSEADLVVLGRTGWSGRKGTLGSTAAAVVARGVGLLVPDVHCSDRVLIVVVRRPGEIGGEAGRLPD